MKGRITYYIGVCVMACLLFACSQEESVEPIVSPGVPEGDISWTDVCSLVPLDSSTGNQY